MSAESTFTRYCEHCVGVTTHWEDEDGFPTCQACGTVNWE